MDRKPIPRRPDALQPEAWIQPIQEAPRKGMSLKLYKVLYGNLLMGLSFGAAFAIFGSASWFFRVAPINLRTSRIPAMESKQRVVLEVSNYLERDGGPRPILKAQPAPQPVAPPVPIVPVVEETPQPEELPQAEVVDQPQAFEQQAPEEAPAAPPEAPPFQQEGPFDIPPAAPEAPVEVSADAAP